VIVSFYPHSHHKNENTHSRRKKIYSRRPLEDQFNFIYKARPFRDHYCSRNGLENYRKTVKIKQKRFGRPFQHLKLIRKFASVASKSGRPSGNHQKRFGQLLKRAYPDDLPVIKFKFLDVPTVNVSPDVGKSPHRYADPTTYISGGKFRKSQHCHENRHATYADRRKTNPTPRARAHRSSENRHQRAAIT
jgi:hypothetical protein